MPIPHIIHYCWFGGNEKPDNIKAFIKGWKEKLTDYTFVEWNESNFSIDDAPEYVKEAYSVKKYAFVSDVARLQALATYGGIYLDTDVMVFKSLEPLLSYSAFAGFEGSKHLPIGTCIIGSEKNGVWVQEQLQDYVDRVFIKDDGSFDTITNVTFINQKMKENGFIGDGKEQDYKDLHIFPVDYFCPRHTTGEYIRTDNTYCDHLGIGSWANNCSNWKSRLLSLVSPRMRTKLIIIKRKLFG